MLSRCCATGRSLGLTASRLFAKQAASEAERGQTMVESAMVIGVVAVLSMTILTALSGLGGDPFAELGGVLNGR